MRPYAGYASLDLSPRANHYQLCASPDESIMCLVGHMHPSSVSSFLAGICQRFTPQLPISPLLSNRIERAGAVVLRLAAWLCRHLATIQAPSRRDEGRT